MKPFMLYVCHSSMFFIVLLFLLLLLKIFNYKRRLMSNLIGSCRPVILRFSASYLGSGLGGSRLSKVVLTSLSPAVFSDSSWGVPEACPACSGSILVSPAGWNHSNYSASPGINSPGPLTPAQSQ